MGNPRPAPESGRGLFALFDWMTGPLPRRLDARPFPLLVLEPGDGAADPGAHLDELRRAAVQMTLPAIAPPLPDPPPDAPGADPGTAGDLAAIALVDTVSEPLTWTQTHSQSGRRRFPRSDLVQSIQAAATEDGSPGGPPYDCRPAIAVGRWKQAALPFGWRGGPVQTPLWWTVLGALTLTLLGGLFQQTRPGVLVNAFEGVGALALLVLVIYRFWLPVMCRFGFGSRYHWFTHTSFFAVLGDGDDGGDDSGLEGRLHRVFERLSKPDAARFLLQIKTFALLEDIRDQHRKATPSLRGFKRTSPPVVFLRDAGRRNGGLALLSAMSDIRARRSEFQPLLVVASVDAATRDELGPAPSGGTPRERYERWRSSLGTDQGPSESVRLPWLLRIPVTGDPAAERTGEGAPAFTARHRPPWTWVWSWAALAATVFICAASLIGLHEVKQRTYCQVGWPIGWNSDTRAKTGTDGHHQECVGVSTHGVRFERRAASISMTGAPLAPDPRHTGARLTIADLQRRIDDENHKVETGREPYVTIVYAGVFTTAPGPDQAQLTVSSIHELAGAHLAQLHNNENGGGSVDNPLKIRLLPANTGQDMAFAPETADRILDLARKDPTIVGVVGLGRNTAKSAEAIRRLDAAGLPVLDTVNSSDALPTLPRYYGLAATDHDEALATRYVIDRELRGRPSERMLLVQRDSSTSDAYSSEIAGDIRSTMAGHPIDTLDYGQNEIGAEVRQKCESTPYSLVYFAGRAEDLPRLLFGLREGGCAGHRLLLFAGDDVSKSQVAMGSPEAQVPPNVVLYYPTFVHMPNLVAENAEEDSGFFRLAQSALGIGGAHPERDPLLVDGQMALAYDAGLALSDAAQYAYHDLGVDKDGARPVAGSATVTTGAVLPELRRVQEQYAATGDIDFHGDNHRQNATDNRGLTMIRVVAGAGGKPEAAPYCGRLNGAKKAPGLHACHN
ncbi:hypothetical protein [Actinomadura napierensis]|uniref:ABC transporter substrate-binding protein n=1 Tax=Actinomadura napierensis TaxID=267854 RepID=A0ABP5LC55_9ACTN